MAAAQATKPAKPTRQKPDAQQIADLALNKELSCRQIAAITGHGKTRIAEIINEVKTHPDLLLFTENKDKVFEGLQAKLINLADDDLLKTMLSRRGFTDVAILEDKIRLIRGQATDLSAIDIRVILDHAPQRISSNNLIELENNNEVKQLKE